MERRASFKSVAKRHWAKMHEAPQRYNWLFTIYNSFLGWNRIRGRRGNRLSFTCAKLDRNQICFQGRENEVVIEPGAQLYGCVIRIMGNHNRIVIGRDTYLMYTELWISKDGNAITVGAKSMISGKKEYPSHIAALEGTSVTVGEDCIMSSAVEIRTGDGHSILNREGKRINPSSSVVIGNHVWLGSGAVLLKGIVIADHCIAGAKSVVTKSITKPYCAVGGNPARILREELDWCKELLEIETSS